MQTHTTKIELRRALAAARAAGKRIVLVPTMGYLHEGHLSLVDHARSHGDVVVMSIFVNPLQFGPSEDLARYPRDLARDAQLAAERGVDVLFAPSDDEVYEAGKPEVTVIAHEIGSRLEGAFRPGHFEGVLTVVAKLFNIVQPDVAVFGQKDFQQCVVVRRLCTDLNFPIEIRIARTVREPDGLALSSRNVFLDPEQRRSATALSRALRSAQASYQSGERDPERLLATAHAVLAEESEVRPQYVDLIHPESLTRPVVADAASVLVIAALVGNTRLIDNMRLAE